MIFTLFFSEVFLGRHSFRTKVPRQVRWKDWGRAVKVTVGLDYKGPSFLKGNVCMCVYVCVYSHVDHNPLLTGTVGGGGAAAVSVY